MIFTFYETSDVARSNKINTNSEYAINIDNFGLNCYGGNGCTHCEFENSYCEDILKLLYKPSTSVEITKEANPELFI